MVRLFGSQLGKVGKKRRKRIKSIFTIVLIIVVIILIVLFGILLGGISTNYNPQAVEQLEVHGDASGTVLLGKNYRVTTLNIGYCGINASADAYLHGGKSSAAASKRIVETNLSDIERYLMESESDFILLQDVDQRSKRSYSVNQKAFFESLPAYASVFAHNYRVNFLLTPLTKPTGAIDCGMQVLSKTGILDAERHKLTGSTASMASSFDYDRCFIAARYEVENKKELVLVNVMFSPAGDGKGVREKQMEALKEYIRDEYKKGNYVIVGGDWGSELPGTRAADYGFSGKRPERYASFPEDIAFENFFWSIGKESPTFRFANTPYKPGKSYIANMDGFLVSDNVFIENTETVDLEFKNTNHNPVEFRFQLLDGSKKK